MTELKVGMPAPDFTLPLGTFGTIALSNMRGKPVVLYFYPKDDTPGCTTEACEFRDSLPAFGNYDAAVIGISKDSVESHAGFAKKHGLNFHLASDAHSHTAEDYGVWVRKNMHGHTYMGIERTTFLIDRVGVIRHIWHKVSAAGHAGEVRQMVEALHMGLPLPGDQKPEPAPVPAPKTTAKPVQKPGKQEKSAAPAKTRASKAKPAPASKPAPKSRPAAKQPVKKAVAKKPVPKKPTAKKSVAKKAAVKKPVSKAKPKAKPAKAKGKKR